MPGIQQPSGHAETHAAARRFANSLLALGIRKGDVVGIQLPNVPEYLISEPSVIVGQVIKGVRRNRLHVFPDRYARLIHYVARFTPWLVPLLDRLSLREIDLGSNANDGMAFA